MSDEVIERIHEEAREAALHAWRGAPPNPYPAHSEEAELWSWSFRQAYMRENGK